MFLKTSLSELVFYALSRSVKGLESRFELFAEILCICNLMLMGQNGTAGIKVYVSYIFLIIDSSR